MSRERMTPKWFRTADWGWRWVVPFVLLMGLDTAKTAWSGDDHLGAHRRVRRLRPWGLATLGNDGALRTVGRIGFGE